MYNKGKDGQQILQEVLKAINSSKKFYSKKEGYVSFILEYNNIRKEIIIEKDIINRLKLISNDNYKLYKILLEQHIDVLITNFKKSLTNYE